MEETTQTPAKKRKPAPKKAVAKKPRKPRTKKKDYETGFYRLKSEVASLEQRVDSLKRNLFYLIGVAALAFSVVSALWYAFFSVAVWDFSIANWHWFGRSVWLIGEIIIFIFAIIFIQEEC